MVNIITALLQKNSILLFDRHTMTEVLRQVVCISDDDGDSDVTTEMGFGSQESVTLKRTRGIREEGEAKQRRTEKKQATINPARNWCFTWFGFKPEEMDELIKDDNVDWVVAQEEICPRTTRNHVQGVLCFKKKVRPSSNFPQWKEIHWEICRNVQAAKLYCRKTESKKVDGLTWNVGDDAVVITTIEPKGWQVRMLKSMETWVGRKIYWCFEYAGNMGKSMFCKYLCVHKGAYILSGKSADMKSAVAMMKKKPKLVIIDIPRSSQQYVSYSGIEEISNGCFFSGKYEGSMVLMNNPIILCFANAPPDYDKMSSDRWELIDLNKEKNPVDEM